MSNNDLTVIGTWCPCFCGFYETILSANYDREIEYLNEVRADNGLARLNYEAYDKIGFEYYDYECNVARKFTNYIFDVLLKHGFVSEYEYEQIHKPREYNFRTDTINVEVKLSRSNIAKILLFLRENKTRLAQRVYDCHTSRSGFISFQSNDVNDWLNKDEFIDSYGLGFILEFIFRELYKTDRNYSVCEDFYYLMEEYVEVSDYELATTGYYCDECSEWFKSDELHFGMCPTCYSDSCEVVLNLTSKGAKFINFSEEVATLNFEFGTNYKSFFQYGRKFYGLYDSDYKFDMLAEAI